MVDSYARALEVMAATPAALHALVAAGPPERLEAPPAEGQWSAAQVVHHMLRIETVLINRRIELMLSQDDPEFPGPPAAGAPDEPRPVLDELAAWEAARTENLAMLRKLTPEQLGRRGRHPRWGTISVREHATEWAYHDLDHLRQLLEIFQGELHGGIGVFQGLYPKPGAAGVA